MACWRDKNGLDLVLALAHAADDLALCLDGPGSGELTGRYTLRTLDDLKFTGSQAGIKVAAYLGKRDLAHAAAEAVADQCPFIDDCLALEVLVAGKGERLANAVNES
jgi:hypothetical protein